MNIHVAKCCKTCCVGSGMCVGHGRVVSSVSASFQCTLHGIMRCGAWILNSMPGHGTLPASCSSLGPATDMRTWLPPQITSVNHR